MYASVEELKDLQEMRENIRRRVGALELCWSCQRVSDCEPALVDDAAPGLALPGLPEQLSVRGKAGEAVVAFPLANHAER